MIKGRFAHDIDILCVSDMMAYSYLSADNVVSQVFKNEDSFDDSDSERREGIYGCLGAFALSHTELQEESCIVTGGVEKAEDRLSSEDKLPNNEEPLENDFQANYSTVEDNNSNECNATTMELTNSYQHWK